MGPTNWRQALLQDLEVLDGSRQRFVQLTPKNTRRAVYITYQECWENGNNIPRVIINVIYYWIHIER